MEINEIVTRAVEYYPIGKEHYEGMITAFCKDWFFINSEKQNSLNGNKTLLLQEIENKIHNRINALEKHIKENFN